MPDLSHMTNEPLHEKNGFFGNREADQRLCYRYTDSTIPLLSKSEILKPLAIFCDCPVRFVSDLVGTPEYWFSHNEAQIEPCIHAQILLNR